MDTWGLFEHWLLVDMLPRSSTTVWAVVASGLSVGFGAIGYVVLVVAESTWSWKPLIQRSTGGLLVL